MVYTTMNQGSARYVFPCFGDVQMKAKFKIKIGHIKNVESFTNGKFVTSEEMYESNFYVKKKILEVIFTIGWWKVKSSFFLDNSPKEQK